MRTKSPHSVGDWLRCLVLDALQQANRAPITTTYVGVGSVPWDDCCGSLIVVPEQVIRSTTFPGENGNEENCIGGQIVLSFAVLLTRCVPTLDDRGRAPSPQQITDAHKRILEDAAIVWNTIGCADLPDEWERALLRQTFTGAEGGCVAVETRVTIGIAEQMWRMP